MSVDQDEDASFSFIDSTDVYASLDGDPVAPTVTQEEFDVDGEAASPREAVVAKEKDSVRRRIFAKSSSTTKENNNESDVGVPLPATKAEAQKKSKTARFSFLKKKGASPREAETTQFASRPEKLPLHAERRRDWAAATSNSRLIDSPVHKENIPPMREKMKMSESGEALTFLTPKISPTEEAPSSSRSSPAHSLATAALPDFNSTSLLGRKMKIRMIKRVLRGGESSGEESRLSLLRQLAISPGGLLADDLRRQAWPLLAGVRLVDASAESSPATTRVSAGLPAYTSEELLANVDHNQVDLDVRRTLARFPPNMRENQRAALQKQLTSLVVRILCNHSELRYYQGFHDICLTFLLVVGEERAYAICDKLAAKNGNFHEFLASSLEEANKILSLMYPLIRHVDPDLELFLWRADVGTMFALSWLITWFGHVIEDFRQIVRTELRWDIVERIFFDATLKMLFLSLFDLFIASHPLMPVYLSAAIVLHRSNEILETECEMPAIHSLLSRMPTSLPLETVVANATELFVQMPPSKLVGEPIKPEAGKFERFFGAREKAMQVDRRGQRRRAGRRQGGGFSAFTFWAVTATAAAIFLYNRYSIFGDPAPNNFLPWL